MEDVGGKEGGREQMTAEDGVGRAWVAIPVQRTESEYLRKESGHHRKSRPVVVAKYMIQWGIRVVAVAVEDTNRQDFGIE